MAARSVVVNLSDEDRGNLRTLAREAARQLGPYSKRAIFLIYGRRIKGAAPDSMEFDALVHERGSVWVGNYPGGLNVSVQRLEEDLEAAFDTWQRDRHGG